MHIYIYVYIYIYEMPKLSIPYSMYQGSFDFIFVRTPRTHGNSEFGRLEAIHAGLSLTHLAVPSD